MSTKKVPCTAAAAGAPWTSFKAAIDDAVARTPPGRIFPDRYPGTTARYPGNTRIYGSPGQIAALHAGGEYASIGQVTDVFIPLPCAWIDWR